MKRYEKYKDSGIEWIGEIPEGWSISRVKYYGLINSGINISGDKISDDGEYPIWGGNGLLGYTNSYNVEKNAIVIGRVGALCGNVRLVKSKIYVTDNALILDIIRIINVEYLYYVLNIANLNKLNTSSAQPLITGTKVKNVNIPIPPIQEQKEIVFYIEAKTAKIDLMVEKCEKKIALLEELKQSVISTAVTRGINPNAEMKDSGIDWIGEIPKQWKIIKLKYIVQMYSGENLKSEQIKQDGLYPVYGGNGVRGYYTYYSNDGDYVLIGRQGALCGNINYAHGRFWATEHAVVCYPIMKFDLLWFGELLRTMNLNQYSMASAQPGLSVERIMNLYIPIPTKEEERLISKYIEAKTAKIDNKIENQRKQIVLLKELKQTIISEAVTGKIKVA